MDKSVDGFINYAIRTTFLIMEFAANSLKCDTLSKIRKKCVILVVFNENNQGPVVLYELLVRHGYLCRFIYYLHDDYLNRLALKDFILASNTMMVGFSFASQSVKVAFGLSRYLRRECLDLPIIFGGVHPTIDPLSCVEHCDAVCIGEGEEALLEMVEKIDSGHDYLTSRNLVYKKDGRVLQNTFNPLIPNLDMLPIRRPYTNDHFAVERGKIFPINQRKYFELLPNARVCYTQMFSRGCPYGCSYCCNSKFHKIYPDWAKIRSASVTSTINEVCENIRFNPDVIKIFIIDDCFLVHDIAWLRDFAAQWRQRVNKELNFFTIPEYITREKLEVLKTINLRYCTIGLQSGSKRINILYNREFSAELFLQACQLIHSLGIGLVVNLIFDNPWEGEEHIRETLEVLTRIEKPFYIMPYSLKIYPGTQLFENYYIDRKKIPSFNLWFEDYNIIKSTDINRILIITQILPGKLIFYLFKNRHKALIKDLLRALYFFFCIVMPIHILRVCGSRHIRQNIKIAFSYRIMALRLIKGLIKGQS